MGFCEKNQCDVRECNRENAFNFDGLVIKFFENQRKNEEMGLEG